MGNSDGEAPVRWAINTLRPRRNRRHFADDIFKCILLNENVLNSIKISLKFFPKGPINNNKALVQIMAWRRPGDKPLSEPRMESLLMHICVTRLNELTQWNRTKWLAFYRRYFKEQVLIWIPLKNFHKFGQMSRTKEFVMQVSILDSNSKNYEHNGFIYWLNFHKCFWVCKTWYAIFRLRRRYSHC